ncbi:ketoreductase [Aspergillus clavatus NRRL 1]|uniref:Very-long-chain 3-oxoacyl-CoA reductase n=1 Tax=Aspergillus clavatus (strain ATCC 1007 / CBS 513.65 / DSM 816 / NCTC 3887 / NRRL 1 / QM 1276 / 107) TaxID=344612 RepID=MKAR_ASPCL|nr:ketoreductase, putative [Aspergillus clavatus NRRL 1]A1C6J8.1 RecName: Full=Very-long-chain 3-oxoacyl-CoA reductase; AltName: Full=3-ketoacyl-CoA reductase; Short=3-ketoreductase; Short=KAR; AltName: Full=Microsomal beta-keto-reductase [Aspergillus clavatus NRRL 1]EAW14019.1 ketoreductase, putative [Aspergillus clavatus NRRL 1]
MDFVSKYMSCLSSWGLDLQPGLQSVGAAVLLATGGLFLASRVLTFVRVLLSLFVLPGKPLRSFGPKGSWAVVTGASDGLGKEFALQLARAGFNIVLVSRTASKLATLAEEITAKHSVQTRTLAMDFAANDDTDYEDLKTLVDGLDVSILINNVGKSHDIPVPFALTPEDEMTDIVTINCLGTLRATQLVIPGMMQRRRGLVLTMGSFGGLLPTPLLATYSGSKAFLQQWSTSLGSELEPYGITVELVQAYLITSAMSKVRRTSALIPSPRAFVSSVLSKIGRNGGSPTYSYSSSPYWSHGLMAYFLTCVLQPMGKLVVGQNRTMHEAIRKRALRKAEREKGKKST